MRPFGTWNNGNIDVLFMYLFLFQCYKKNNPQTKFESSSSYRDFPSLLYLAAMLKPWNSKRVVFAAAQAVGVLYAAAVLHRTSWNCKATVAQFVPHLDVLNMLGG